MKTPPPRDAGFVAAVEVVYLGIAALVMVVFIGYLGRLSAAGVQVTNSAQDAARAASIADDPDEASTAAARAVERSGLPTRCQGYNLPGGAGNLHEKFSQDLSSGCQGQYWHAHSRPRHPRLQCPPHNHIA